MSEETPTEVEEAPDEVVDTEATPDVETETPETPPAPEPETPAAPEPTKPADPPAPEKPEPIENIHELVTEYQDILAKIEADKFDIIDDGPAAVKNSMKLVGVLAKRIQVLESDLSSRTQQKAAEDFWGEGYTKAYAAVPVEQGKSLWTETQAWAQKNNRSHEQAVARWETLMETKASKPATPPKPTPPQTRPSGKGVATAAEPESENEGMVARVSHKALKTLGW